MINRESSVVIKKPVTDIGDDHLVAIHVDDVCL